MSRVRSEGHAPSPCPLFLLLHLGRELVGGREMLCAEIEMRERERETERQRQVEGEGRLHPGHFLSLYLLVALPEAVGPLAGGAGSSLLPFPSRPSALSGLRSLEPRCLKHRALPLLGQASAARPRHPTGCGQRAHCCPSGQ